MVYKNKLALTFATATVFTMGIAVAATPTITLVFVDPQGLCKDHGGHTNFSFNYMYEAGGGIEYYSGPTWVTSPLASISPPSPPDDGVAHNYLNFQITGQGDCGAMELDYQHPGSCYLTNLIPAENQQTSYSYKITLSPHATGNHTYGTDMYNLGCHVEAYAST